MPVEKFVPNYRKYYIQDLNNHILSVLGQKVENVRDLYDVFFYEKLNQVARYRIHFQVSLYYFYSRTWFVSLLHAVIFTAASFYLLIPVPPSNIVTIVPGESAGVLLEKSILLVLLSYSVAFVAFRQSSNVIKQVSFFEKALVDYHQEEIREIVRASGHMEGSVSPPSK